MEISSVSIFGNVQISTQAIKELCNRNIPICYFSSGGWFTGMTNGISGNNIDLRIKQFDTASQNEKSLEIAKGFITGKIKNSRTMLRRNGKDIKSETLENLSELSRKILTSKNLGELLGIEGLAARIYFSNFTKMLKSSENHADFNFNSRNRRPPKDPVNAILSYLYSILAKDMTIIAATVGFDPYLGFLHKPKYGKPALALDLMEEFRPIICDSVVITALNSNE
ncbi:MAG: CRISPR-associated protein Cas1 [Thermoplasmatales archaeon Gpl]|nr:MAG: CRISPR-associated protein Cas1 [Thermoplasmatales archaeon Gpl]